MWLGPLLPQPVQFPLERGQPLGRLPDGFRVSGATLIAGARDELVPLRQTLFDFKGSVQAGETSDSETIRERVMAAEAARVARGE